MKLNFIVIGAAKCGTTSLCTLLGQHPQVFMSNPKEPHFFGREPDPNKTMKWYSSLFKNASGKAAIGEGSTSYTHPDIINKAASDIHAYIPDCRLIYMVRHPLKRLESDWKMRSHEGWSSGSVNEAIKSQRTLITHGMYWQNLSVYRRLFPDEQILIVFLEDFSDNPERELGRCLKHINVDPTVIINETDIRRNQSKDFRKDGKIAGLLRRIPYFESINSIIPGWLKQGPKKILTRKENFVVGWDEQIRKEVITELCEDSRKFLEHCGKPVNFWDYNNQNLAQKRENIE